MRPGGAELATSAIVPSGPLKGTSAESSEVESAMGASAFGLLFKVACSVGVEELGIEVSIAASAFVENGQNAFAQLGRSVMVATARVANPAIIRNCCLSLIGGKGERWVCTYKNGLHTLVYKPFLG